jgi:hypothetical protein
MIKRMNKRAWLRIVEAVIAILIVTGAILYIVSNNGTKKDISATVYERQAQILDLISSNDSLRASVIAGDNNRINGVISLMIPGNWNFTTNICELDNICNSGDTPKDRDVYVTERMITSTLDNYSPKKIRLFMWMK